MSDRYIPLAKQQAITQQDLDNATQNNLSAQAQVDAPAIRTKEDFCSPIVRLTRAPGRFC